MLRQFVRLRAGALRPAALLAVGLVVASCVTVTAESEINNDLSGTHTLTVTMDRSALESLGDEFNPDDVQEEMTPDNVPEGYEVEVIDTEDEVGSTISTTVDDSSQLGDVLNDLFNAGDTEAEPVEPFSGTLERDGNTYRLNVTVDGNELAQSGEESVGGEDTGFDMDQLLDMTYTIYLPGELQETNGVELEDGGIQWELPTSGTLDMTAVSETESDSNLLLWLLVGGVSLLVLIGLAALVILLVLARRKPAPAPAAPPPAPPSEYDPRDTPSRPMTQPTPRSDPFADTAPTPPVWMTAPETASPATPPAAPPPPEPRAADEPTGDEDSPAPERPAGQPPAS
jgi:hypothetical protein